MKRYIIDAQTLQQSSFEFDLEVGNELFEAMEMTEMSEVNYNFHVVGTRLTTNKLEIEIDGEGFREVKQIFETEGENNLEKTIEILQRRANSSKSIFRL